MPNIRDARILIMATDGFEQSELMQPLETLREAGALVHVCAPQGPEIKGWKDKNWGESVPVDLAISSVAASEYHCLILPGGQMNPDVLRMNDDAVDLVLDFLHSGKVVAAICHAPWMLIEAGVVEGRQMTSWGSLKTDIVNAGGQWIDREVVVDNGIITSRSPDDLGAFIAKIIEEIETGEHLEGEPFRASA
jgi:protease I